MNKILILLMTASNLFAQFYGGYGDGFASSATSSGVPLPVEITVFSAEIQNGDVVINWQTATETDNYGFEVERSENPDNETLQLTWLKIGFVEGHGNSNSVKNYVFVDEKVKHSSYCYRLKQIDTDGSFEYSAVINVVVPNIPSEVLLLQNYPNPFNPATTISYAVPEKAFVELVIYSPTGELLENLVNDYRDPGYYTVKWYPVHLAGGVYLYQLKYNGILKSGKMLYLK